MKKLITVAVALGLVTFLVSGCGGGGSASDVAKAFYKAGNEGDYVKAKSYLSFQAREILEMGGLGLEFENAMDSATKKGTIAQIEVKGGQEYPGGVTAMVSLTLHYEDGTQEQDTLMMEKVDGNWKIFESSLLMIKKSGALSPLK